MKKLIQKKYTYLVLIGLFFLPVVSQAKTFKDLVDTVTGGLASAIVAFLFALAFAFFFWGVVQYVLSPTQDAREKGKGFILWSLIGLTAMFSVYGLIRLVSETLFK